MLYLDAPMRIPSLSCVLALAFAVAVAAPLSCGGRGGNPGGGGDGSAGDAGDGADGAVSPSGEIEPNVVCAPADPAATRYVDHAQGVDDATHGDQPGTRAFRTVKYALAHATGDIVLAAGAYSSAMAEDSPPYLLVGAQSLLGDIADATKVVITPAQRSPGGEAVGVTLAGTRNRIDHITVEGPSGIALEVSAFPARDSEPHCVTNNVFSDVSAAIWAHQGGVHVANNTFRLLHTAIQWDADDSSSQIDDNNFVANGADLYCTHGANPNLTGHGNVRGGGTIVCLACANCPFR